MSQANERRPGVGTEAATEVRAGSRTEASIARLADIARRRAAAHRLPQFACGHADSLDCLARPVPDTPRNLQASRRAWWHLRQHGLLDAEGWLDAVLTPGGGR